VERAIKIMANASETVDLSVIIACYNEMPWMRPNVSRVQQILESSKYSYEVILFDDASTDGTKSVGPELAEKDKRIKYFAHDKNYGRGKTVTDGIKSANGRIVGFIDMDLEVPAEYIIPIALEIENGADVAVAARLEHSNLEGLPLAKRLSVLSYWFFRYILGSGYSLLTKLLLGVKLKDTEVGFKFFKRDKILPILDEVNDNHWFWDTEIMARAYYKGLTIKEYPALYLKNPHKKSTVKAFQDSVYYFKKLINFRKKVLPGLRKKMFRG